MEYTFSWGWFIIGLIIVVLSSCAVIWHRPLADNFGRGVASYDKVKLYGIIGCGVGLIVMLNLHSLILNALLSQLFGRS